MQCRLIYAHSLRNRVFFDDLNSPSLDYRAFEMIKSEKDLSKHSQETRAAKVANQTEKKSTKRLTSKSDGLKEGNAKMRTHSEDKFEGNDFNNAIVGANSATSVNTSCGSVDGEEQLKLTTEDFIYFKSYLLAQKSALLNRSMEFQKIQRQGRTHSAEEVETATNDLAENVTFQLMERDHALLFQIENALSRIAAGTFGQCESCSISISVKRLKIRPFSTLCVDCMEEREDSSH